MTNIFQNDFSLIRIEACPFPEGVKSPGQG